MATAGLKTNWIELSAVSTGIGFLMARARTFVRKPTDDRNFDEIVAKCT